ncbi:MAG: methylated-DNA--[protein]-cysteine S-methyltransferase [Pseudomonadota bacterium]
MTEPALEFRATAPSPFGLLEITERNDAIVRLTWPARGPEVEPPTPLLEAATRQLQEYFDGRRQDFDLPLRVEAAEFERAVCEQMRAIPFGETRTYGDIAKALATAAQPVGRACGANPIPIIIPCHRVLGADGLGGFSASGGVEDKVWLLKHEGAAGLLI